MEVPTPITLICLSTTPGTGPPCRHNFPLGFICLGTNMVREGPGAAAGMGFIAASRSEYGGDVSGKESNAFDTDLSADVKPDRHL